MLSTLKKMGLFHGLFLVIELLAYVFLRKYVYLFPWGITGVLVAQLVLLILSLFILLVVFIIKATQGKSLYFLSKRIVSVLLWMMILPWMLGLQVIISEMLIYSPHQGGISIIKTVDINNSEQGISIRSMDLDQPIILFLSGGPGGAQMPATRRFLKDLEDTYTIVNWDQPGTGKSYDAIYRYPLTPEVYIEDAHALTQYLKETYQKDKIYLIGESWGTYLAVELATRFPEDYYAVINTGQMVDFTETEEACYDFALHLAIEEGDDKLYHRLITLGRPPYEGERVALDMNTYLNPLYMWMETHEDIYHPNWNTFHLLFSPEYSMYDSVHIVKGLLTTFSVVYPQLYGIDLRVSHHTFDIPIYIFQGKYDVNAPTYLAEDYMNQIIAPDKELVLFEHSGHNPWINEYDLFIKEVKLHFTQHQHE